ncbi:cyclin-domain-containing protein, partial [Radiomyces spectabilis]|uniref:cyclin-domain-containing protein n=1 Tax=Radiomyces spectabilis TaxID=64574 RepID=UPI00221E90AB
MGHNNPYISAETNVIPPPFPPQTMNGMALAATQTEPLPHTTQLQTVALTLIQLAEFASTMVYLMWHARRPSVMALHSASVDNTSNVLVHRDPDHNRETATIANETSLRFKRFCKDILTATQLSESVVMLALKYIAMLLQNNPNIQGAEGSEYRLFTVALMLGNKFLDDNTYTNKTWADVSGMKVSDLNIMELEFLDVLKFRIFVRKEEHDRWKVSLFALREQLEIAYQAEEQEKRQSQQTAHQQYMYLLSNAQQAYYTSRLPNRPLTRVPLRIPRYPVYHPQTAPPQPMTSVNNPIMTSIYDNPIPEPVYSTQSFEAT